MRFNQNNFTIIRKRNKLIVAVKDRLDSLTAPKIQEQLEAELKVIEKIIFDFAELNYISSAGLRLLLTAMQVMEEQGEMVVRNVTPAVMDVFEITGFINDLTIE